MTWQAHVLSEGAAEGHVLRLDAPISFWGGIDPTSAKVILARHPQNGVSIADRVVVAPALIGSSSSSSVLLELIHNGMAPRAIILGAADAILPVGAIVARHMGWRPPPICALADPPFETGAHLRILNGGLIECPAS